MLRDQGVSRTQLDAQLRAGVLERVRRGVYAAASHACGAARASVAHGGVPACVTAAEHLGLWVLEPDSAVHVWLTGDGHRYRHDGCSCIEHWDDGTRTDAFGLPSVPRILRQLLACRGVEEFFVVLESALRMGRIDARGVTWLRRHTNDAAREAIDLAQADADSGLESLVRWRLRKHRLTVRTQVRIPGVGRIDLLIGDRLILETDGRVNHAGADLRHKDLVRDAHAAMWGYVTLRFDYALVVHDWDLVERAILAHVGAGRHL